MIKGSASDYIKVKKQNAIYTGIKVDAQLTGTTVNPRKRNGYYYNNLLNVNIPQPCSFTGCTGGVFTNARSYQLRLDFKGGKQYNQYVCNCQNAPINDILDFNSCAIVEMPSTDVVACPCTACAFN